MYAVCNAAEGEPATFKNRLLLRTNPYQALEGWPSPPTRSAPNAPTSA
jgi:NADH:ubiquinone oxidoreductase subunit F (NADH-binding)